MQTLVAILGIIGLIGWSNQHQSREQLYWFIKVRSYVLTLGAESALKPQDSFKECENCPEMIVVPAGEFTMGSSKSEKGHNDNESPRHSVTIPRAFAVSKFAVTFDEWDTCVALGGCTPAWDGDWGRGKRPVINLSWNRAKQYVAWVSALTGKPYRLLSEAEWEYAARAGTTTRYCFGDDESGLGEYAWYVENSDFMTHPVGEKRPNAFGLYDMHGNVWQWVEDHYHDTYDGAPTDGSPWVQDGDESLHVMRGGAWIFIPQYLRAASRNEDSSEAWGTAFGFRLARTLSLDRVPIATSRRRTTG